MCTIAAFLGILGHDVDIFARKKLDVCSTAGDFKHALVAVVYEQRLYIYTMQWFLMGPHSISDPIPVSPNWGWSTSCPQFLRLEVQPGFWVTLAQRNPDRCRGFCGNKDISGVWHFKIDYCSAQRF